MNDHFLSLEQMAELYTVEQDWISEKALIEESPELCSKATLEAYQLGSSSNVARIKQSLENKDIIDTGNCESVFVDPVFREWLRIRYFKIQRVQHGRVAGGSALDDP